MNAEFIAMLEYLEKEKGIKRDVLIETVQSALLSAAKKSVEAGRNLEVVMDPKTGEIRARAQLVVVEKVNDKHDEIALSKAKAVKADVKLGEEIWVDVTPGDLGRIGAQTARQAIMQRIRQVEKQMIYDEFRDRAGEIVSGTVRRFERQDVIVDLGKFEAVMPNRERVQTEDYAIGDRVRAYVVAVENTSRGPEIILSRSHPNFVRRLFETEVAEIADRTVEIKAIAREAGFRTKVAVFSANEKVDPVGACVGMKGSRIHGIVRELKNENIDVINWTNNTQLLIQRSLTPSKITSMELDSEKLHANVYLKPDQVSLAIGRKGVNIKLAQELTGYSIDVFRDNEGETEEFDIDLDEFSDEIEKWVIDELKRIGCDTAHSVLDLTAEELERRTDLERETIDEVRRVLKEEFEKE